MPIAYSPVDQTATRLFDGAQLRLARIFNELTLDELAGHVGKTRQYVHKLEVGNARPTDELVADLARALRVKPAFFFTGRLNVDESQFHFRKQFTTRSTIKHVVVARGELFSRLVCILEAHLSLPEVRFESVDAESADEIERIADLCRTEWGLGFGPIEHMTRLAENLGALVTTFKGISKEVDALSLSLSRPIIVRNEAKQSPSRQRFDVAHEIGHCILHFGKVTGDRYTENQANRFASALLVPRTMMAKHFPRSRGSRLDWTALREFKLTWKVSKAASLYRARQLGLITDDQYRTGVITLNRTGEANAEREDIVMSKEQPELLKHSFDVLAQEKDIYGEHIAAALQIETSLLEDLVGFALPAVATTNLRVRPKFHIVANCNVKMD